MGARSVSVANGNDKGIGNGADQEHDRHQLQPSEESLPPKEKAGALTGQEQVPKLLDTLSKVRQLIGSKTDISIPGAVQARCTQYCTCTSGQYQAIFCVDLSHAELKWQSQAFRH